MNAAAIQAFSSVRAFFAPVDRATSTPTPFDPASAATFNFDAPPAPWLDLGSIRDFRRASATSQSALRAGTRGAVNTQIRAQLDARVQLEFLHWGKLQMALAAGSQHINVLARTNGVTDPACAILPGSTATHLVLSPTDAARFHAGCIVVVDTNYAGQTGYIGAGISAAYAKPGQTSDANFTRRFSFNVARIGNATATSLELDRPLLAGVPANSLMQKVTAFTDREGGMFFQEWSAVFFLVNEAGGRICFYYPRLQPAAPAAEAALSLGDPTADSAPQSARASSQHASSISSSNSGGSKSLANGVPHSSSFLARVGSDGTGPGLTTTGCDSLSLATLRASFIALPVTDLTDNEPVVCYRTYIPAANAALY
jgi:hypothetical protein